MTAAFWMAVTVAVLLAVALARTAVRLRQRTRQLTNLQALVGGDEAVRAAGRCVLSDDERRIFRHIAVREDQP